MSNTQIILIICSLFGVFIYVKFIRSFKLKPYKARDPEKDINIRMTTDATEWAAGNNFDFLGFYTVQFGIMSGFMAAWKLKEKSIYLCQYIIRTNRETVKASEFVTVFENEIELNTANSKDAILRPKPLGKYVQSFSRCYFDELYMKHRDAEKYLITRGGARVEMSPIDFEEYFIDSLKKENRYHWKHWYWIFLIFYFYFVRRNRWHNKSIKKQHELGMIKLPNEIFLK